MALINQGGKLLLRDGALGTGQGCCCNKCSGPCSTRFVDGVPVNVDCQGNCDCVLHPCGCFDLLDGVAYPWSSCAAPCGENESRVSLAICMDGPDEQIEGVRGQIEGWAQSVRDWMDENGYAATSYDSENCTPVQNDGSQAVHIVVHGCCENGFDTAGACLNIGDLEPALLERPYAASVLWNAQPGGDCDPPSGFPGFIIPPCAENPLP